MEINANDKLPTFSSSMAQLVCCLTHIPRGPGSIPSHGSLLFAFISMCYYMIYFIIIIIITC